MLFCERGHKCEENTKFQTPKFSSVIEKIRGKFNDSKIIELLETGFNSTKDQKKPLAWAVNFIDEFLFDLQEMTVQNFLNKERTPGLASFNCFGN